MHSNTQGKLRILAYATSLFSAGLSLLHFLRIRSPKHNTFAAPKLLAAALSPYLAITGVLGMFLGFLSRTPFALVAGALGLWASARYVWRVVTASAKVATAFDRNEWESTEFRRADHMLRGRWTWHLPALPEPEWQQNIPFYTIPDSERTLLCDLWQPPAGIQPSGLALIYLHGSGWHFLDKDVGTRAFFRHLAAQGHVVMDVAYRLCPEANWRGMLADAKHAIAWMKANAAQFGVDPEQVVISGGSAGGHLALLAAYTAHVPDLTPDDLKDVDLAPRAVISWYGPTDMLAYNAHAGMLFATLVQPGTDGLLERLQSWLMRAMGFNMPNPRHWQPGLTVQENMMRALFGGVPDEVPDEYRLASPIKYAGPECPPTLLLQGEHDSITPAAAVRALACRLREAGATVKHVEYPQTEHAFDLILPRLAPAAQASLYEVERFLALVNSPRYVTKTDPRLVTPPAPADTTLQPIR
jgi:acetyl esterase/lipase